MQKAFKRLLRVLEALFVHLEVFKDHTKPLKETSNTPPLTIVLTIPLIFSDIQNFSLVTLIKRFLQSMFIAMKRVIDCCVDTSSRVFT